jgi:hypothetical protein
MEPDHSIEMEDSIKTEDLLRTRLRCLQPHEWQGVEDADIEKTRSAMSAPGVPGTRGRQLWRF